MGFSEEGADWIRTISLATVLARSITRSLWGKIWRLDENPLHISYTVHCILTMNGELNQVLINN